MKQVALVLVALLLTLFAWWFIQSDNVSVAVNGNEIAGPMKALAGSWVVLVAMVFLFSMAILMAFVVAGIGLMVLGALVLAGLIVAAVEFPFLLPLLLPLFVVWAFVAWVRRGKARTSPLKQDHGMAEPSRSDER